MDGFDTRFESVKLHVRQSLLVVFDEPCLVFVIVRWAEPFTGDTAAIHKLKITFGWIDWFVGTGKNFAFALLERVTNGGFL